MEKRRSRTQRQTSCPTVGALLRYRTRTVARNRLSEAALRPYEPLMAVSRDSIFPEGRIRADSALRRQMNDMSLRCVQQGKLTVEVDLLGAVRVRSIGIRISRRITAQGHAWVNGPAWRASRLVRTGLPLGIDHVSSCVCLISGSRRRCLHTGTCFQ
jgi:hypothetical protein